MSTLKQRLRRKNASGSYDTIYLQADMSNVTGMLGVANGGTGATTAAQALANLGGISGDHTHNATSVIMQDGTTVQEAIDDMGQSAITEGKAVIAAAITEKGVQTDPSALFETMAENIRSFDISMTKQLPFSYNGQWRERSDGVVELLTSGTLKITRTIDVDIFLVGGGGGGHDNGGRNADNGGGGGGGGYTLTVSNVSLLGNNNYSITIGNGGQAGYDGEPTIFNNTYTANGGYSGKLYIGGNGGSGGGCGTYSWSSDGSLGGYDGSNGVDNGYGTVGIGQGTTTREFDEVTGKLYGCGGGGGGYAKWIQSPISNIYIPSNDDIAGSGSGAIYSRSSGINISRPAIAALPNTGGGGGGGGYAKWIQSPISNIYIPSNDDIAGSGSGAIYSRSSGINISRPAIAALPNTGGGGGGGENSLPPSAGGSGIICIRVHTI